MIQKYTYGTPFETDAIVTSIWLTVPSKALSALKCMLQIEIFHVFIYVFMFHFFMLFAQFNPLTSTSTFTTLNAVIASIVSLTFS